MGIAGGVGVGSGAGVAALESSMAKSPSLVDPGWRTSPGGGGRGAEGVDDKLASDLSLEGKKAVSFAGPGFGSTPSAVKSLTHDVAGETCRRESEGVEGVGETTAAPGPSPEAAW